MLAVLDDTLPTWAVHVVVGLEHDGAATVGARLATLVDEPTSSRRRAANHDLVLGTARRSRLIKATAAALGVKEVVVAAVLEHECTLHSRLPCVIRDLVWTTRGLTRRAHLGLVDVSPETTKVEVVRTVDVDVIGVDRVIWTADRARDHRRRVVRPGAHVHGFGRRIADCGFLGAKLAHAVVHVVRAVDVRDVRSLPTVDIVKAITQNATIFSQTRSMRLKGVVRWISSFAIRTHRSLLPAWLTLEPPEIAFPLYAHGPLRSGAEWTAMPPPVENRKYVPSDRRTIDGSCELTHTPVQVSGSAYALTRLTSSGSPSRNDTSLTMTVDVEDKNGG